jgi:hypothetical protein
VLQGVSHMESGRWEDAAGSFVNAMRAAFAQGRPTGQDAQVTPALISYVMSHFDSANTSAELCRQPAHPAYHLAVCTT